MSTGVTPGSHDSFWSYIGFGRTSPRRRRSVKTTPDRHSGGRNIKSTSTAWKPSQAALMTQSQRTRYLKTAGIIAIILLFIFALSPSPQPTTAPIDTPAAAPAASPAAPQKAAPEAAPPAVSPASAPAPASGSSTKCTKPYDSSKPLIQYALMIDAGSTGSRIHVYRFNNCGPTPELEHEEFKMTEKKKGGSGLSSYREDAEGAAKSLDPLMQVAVETVPKEYQSCSPVAVKATAGLRMLGDDMSKKILEAVRHRLETQYPFPVVSKEQHGVEIMDGKDEGVYAWITTNYLLGKIGTAEDTPTAAIFDLGGGSTQIVFHPSFHNKLAGQPETLAEGDHKYALNFGGRDFALYQHSHLGYGLMEARKAIHRAIIEAKHEANPKDQSWLSKPITNPCISPGMSLDVNATLSDGHPLGSEVSVKMVGPSQPSGAQCRGITEKILKKHAKCDLAPCSFNGVHQPSLEKTFSREDVYIFSYFYDRVSPLGMPESFTIRELQALTSNVCAGEDGWGVFEGVPKALEELKDRPEYCLDLNFMVSLLHTGYEMPLDREVKTAKKIDGNELGWCLGASLPLLNKGSGWECRVKQIS